MLAIHKICFSWNQNFDKYMKFIAHEIFVLYGTDYGREISDTNIDS